METSWDLPSPAEQSAPPSGVPTANSLPNEITSPSQQDMLQCLGTALEGDLTGTRFAEEARSLR